ncbi:glycosyltransferase family 4 protein [Bosea sp. 47.2.35]|uniref:glycosyltransferase family 4 protein n=1 Tax=Bosea sp. 47.2.35 TaxID=2969304 RepID=UPI00214FC37F|nr:glycosyltransferase family 4 protein [Bosea sp. 47.2.35]MCR4524325.1 glycosyltransferase family 4 protein [Bosea sp. 47.2.35]
MTRVAYLSSLYPAPSHTFIEREIRALESTGIEIIRFSIRKPKFEEIIAETAREELRQTRWLVPPAPGAFIKSVIWAAATRPRRLVSTLREALSGVRSARDRLKWVAYWAEAILLAYWAKRAGASHLHCHFGNSGSNTAMIAAKLAQLPFSITFHGIDLDEPDRFRHSAKLRDCAFAVCISDFGRQILLAHNGDRDASKVHVVRCGFEPIAPEAVIALPARNHIVCVARLSPEKGHDTLLAALGILKRRGVAFTCTLVGGGPLEEEIRKQIKDAELASVIEMAGIRTPAEVQAHIADADLAVLASYGEGIPIALMEAFAQKRPVIATRVGGIPELVKDGINGRLVTPGDEVELAAAIEAVLSDQAAAARMGESGWRTVGEQHDLKASTLEMRKLFTHAVLRASQA